MSVLFIWKLRSHERLRLFLVFVIAFCNLSTFVIQSFQLTMSFAALSSKRQNEFRLCILLVVTRALPHLLHVIEDAAFLLSRLFDKADNVSFSSKIPIIFNLRRVVVPSCLVDLPMIRFLCLFSICRSCFASLPCNNWRNKKCFSTGSCQI